MDRATLTEQIQLEAVTNNFKFNGWNREGVWIADGSSGNAMVRRRVKYFRRNSDGALFEVVNRTETKALPAGAVSFFVGIRGAR